MFTTLTYLFFVVLVDTIFCGNWIYYNSDGNIRVKQIKMIVW